MRFAGSTLLEMHRVCQELLHCIPSEIALLCLHHSNFRDALANGKVPRRA